MEIKKYYLVDPLTKKFIYMGQDGGSPIRIDTKSVPFELVEKTEDATIFPSVERAMLFSEFLKEDLEVVDYAKSGNTRVFKTQKGIQAKVYSTTLELTEELC